MPVGMRVPLSLFVPTPLAYDSFTRANGALGNSEATGPDSQPVTARAWTGATWAISTNAAVNTPALGANDVVNGGFATDADWAKGAGWTIDTGDSNVAEAVAVTNATALSNSSEPFSTAGTWYSVTLDVSGYVAGYLQVLVEGSSGLGPRISANGSYVRTGRSTIAGQLAFIGTVAPDQFTGNVDNATRRPLTLSQLIASITATHADCICDANVTFTLGTQAGLILRLDSAASPANFLQVFLNATQAGSVNCVLNKCVAGVYTNLISTGITYVAGATLRVIISGVSVSVFYNNTQVGTTQTLVSPADNAVINGNLHGLFSTSALNSLDNFAVYPRGNSNEYGALDRWSGGNP